MHARHYSDKLGLHLRRGTQPVWIVINAVQWNLRHTQWWRHDVQIEDGRCERSVHIVSSVQVPASECKSVRLINKPQTQWRTMLISQETSSSPRDELISHTSSRRRAIIMSLLCDMYVRARVQTLSDNSVVVEDNYEELGGIKTKQARYVSSLIWPNFALGWYMYMENRLSMALWHIKW